MTRHQEYSRSREDRTLLCTLPKRKYCSFPFLCFIRHQSLAFLKSRLNKNLAYPHRIFNASLSTHSSPYLSLSLILSSLSIYLLFYFFMSRSLSLSLSHTHTHTHTISLSPSLYLYLSPSLPRPLSFFLSPFRALFFSLF